MLTDRLKGSDGNPVKSPFPFVHHPQQVDSVARLREVLSNAALANYYGDIAGTGLDHVAFAWTFTTQPVLEDMVLLRNGLYGKGPFASFATQFPPKVSVLPAAGKNAGAPSDQPAGWKTDPACAPHVKNPYIVDPNLPDVFKALNDLYSSAFGYDKGDVKALNEENTHVDHVVIGTYQSPFLEGDPKGQDPDARFHVNFKTGEGDIRSDTVSFMLVVPKETAQYKQPFPVTLWGHGVGGNFTEALEYGGNFARNGVATLAINMPQHGLPFDNSFRVPANADLIPDCLAPWVDAVLTSRAIDRNGDGVADPGWWWWTSHIANVRDNVRQGTLDEMQLTRILRTFDGKTMSGQDFNDDGKEDLAGDFDADGVPDIGGPTNAIWASGESLGGIMSEIQGGVDHQLSGTAPMSGGGGLTHIGYRSYGVTESFGQLFGPLLIGIPASQRPDKHNSDGTTTKQTNCAASQISVRIFAEDGDDIPETEIACLNADEAGPNKTIVLTNLSQQLGQRAHCARTGPDGSFRVEFGATYLDDLDVQLWNEPDAVDSYATCVVKTGSTAGRHITTFEQPAPQYHSTDQTCPTSACAQFMDLFLPGRLPARRDPRRPRLQAKRRRRAALLVPRADRRRPGRPHQLRAVLHDAHAARSGRQPGEAAPDAQHEHSRRRVRGHRDGHRLRARGRRAAVPPAGRAHALPRVRRLRDAAAALRRVRARDAQPGAHRQLRGRGHRALRPAPRGPRVRRELRSLGRRRPARARLRSIRRPARTRSTTPTG